METYELGKGVEEVLKPKSIAVVGASVATDKQELTGGTAVIGNLLRYGYSGNIYPINPKYPEIMNCKAYKTIGEVPEKVDLVVIAVASQRVPAVMQECGEAGVKAVNVISSGFSEIAEPRGKELQKEIISIANTYGMRLVGPNNLGVINLHDKIVASTSAGLWCGKLTPGSIGWVSQSGALTSSLLPRAMDSGAGLAYVVTLGNEADLEMSDFIWYMLDDPRVDVVAAYIERIQDMEKFKQVALKARQVGKPIIAMKTGSSERGAAAAMAHTGSLVGSETLYGAFFKQHGILRAESIDELFETALLLSKWKGHGPTSNLAIVTTSGGAGGILADLCEPAGLNIPPLSKGIQERIMQAVPEFGSAQNPVDLTAQILKTPDQLLEVGKLLDESSEIDGVLFALTALPPESSRRFARIISTYSESTHKPIMVCWFTGTMNNEAITLIRENGIPCYTDFKTAVTALRRRSQYLEYMKFDLHEAGAEITGEFAVEKTGTFSEYESKNLLRKFGVPTTHEFLAGSLQETIKAAEKIGYPVVIKIDSTDIPHKTEADVVRLNIKSENELRAAYDQITQNAKSNKPDAKINGVLVQEMVTGGVEAFIGATFDSQFGPNIVYGLGGIYVELFKDIAHRIAPVSEAEALAMIEETKSALILKGARGKGPYDMQALAKLIVCVSVAVVKLGSRLAELDLNPVIVTKNGVKVVDALLVTK